MNDEGISPLLMAVIQGHCGVVRILLEQGADTSLRSPEGKSPLHLAVEHSRVDIAAVLLWEGRASPDDKGSDGATLLELALRCGRAHMVKVLLEGKL